MLKIWIFYILLLFSSYVYSNPLTNIKCSMAFFNPMAVHNSIHKQESLMQPEDMQQMKKLNDKVSIKDAIEKDILLEINYTNPYTNIHKIEQLARHLDQIHKNRNKQHLK